MSSATVGTTKVKRGNTTMIEADENGSFDFCTTSKNPRPHPSLSTMGGLYFPVCIENGID